MTSSLAGSTRRCRGLTDIIPQYDDSQSDKISNASSESDHKSGIKIHHLTNSCILGNSRFPKLEECAHFHYEYVELNSLQLSLYEEEDLKSLSGAEGNENSENKWLTVKVVSQGQSWLLRRSYENFRMLDQQLHQCIYDRKFSQLPELPPLDNLQQKQEPQTYIKCQLSKYCERFSSIAGNLINCGPVLNWLQLDNRGRRILVTDGDNCPINTPAVAAAYAVKKYAAVAADEISFDVGDMISVIDMPPPEDSVWWRGKRGFMVGFFPSNCVAVITDKVPRNLQLNQSASIVEPSKPVLRKHGKLIAFFRAFILSRPSKRHLKQSGILRERVFGCDLGEHLLNSGREVPMVLKCCSEFIEKHGIVDGIYRLSGATSNIQKLRTTFDEDRIPALYNDNSILQDIHSVASLLKMYFRELPNPLCTYQLYRIFVHAVQNTDPTKRVASMREAVQKLPPPHFRTLEYLMRHLSRVAEHGGRTGMTARNIAIVWAPNLLRCKELEVGGVAALQGVGVQAVVTEFLISNVDLVFCNDNASLLCHSRRVRPKSLSLGTPTKLLSLEEAQSKKMGAESMHDNYIEVGGGPSNLPKLYHTVIELPHRKRIQVKRSPLGWKSFFLRSSSSGGGGSTNLRKSSSTNSGKRKTSTSTEISYKPIEIVPKTECETKSRLRNVRSEESLASAAGNGSSVRNSVCVDYLSPPSPKLPGTSCHSRSVSHDSYFDHLAENTPMHSNIHQDEEGLSDLHMNFDLDESEMKIFSEESSQLFSTASSLEQLQGNAKKVAMLASAENTIIVDPSPKKHKTSGNSSCSSVTLSDDMTAVCNKRSRLEEKFNEDFSYIDSQSDRLSVADLKNSVKIPDVKKGLSAMELVVEVDIHRPPSILSLPITNDTSLSPCTMSDSTIENTIPYTPLSEYSCTLSSNYEGTYHPLTSSISSSLMPKSSTESMKSCEPLKKNANVAENRFSYHGELQTPVIPVAKNRLSLQTMSCVTGEHELSTDLRKAIDTNNRSEIKTECETKEAEDEQRLFNDRLSWNGKEGEIQEEEVTSVGGADNGDSNSSSESTEVAQQLSQYENLPKLELVLNDKEMFSETKKTISPINDSTYELVTVVANRMTPVSADENLSFTNGREVCADTVESNYEEVRPPSYCVEEYEEMSSVYEENDIYEGDGMGLLMPQRKSSYEEISMLNDASLWSKRRSCNESLDSSEDEAMIENNLYESLVAEDSSPEPSSNRSLKTVSSVMTSSSDQCEGIFQYKNIMISSTNSDKVMQTSFTDTKPLLVPDPHSPFSDTEHLAASSPIPILTENYADDDGNSESNSCSHQIKQEIESKSTPPAEHPLVEENEKREVVVESGNGSLSSGHTKSVQDLVSKFEWSAEDDPAAVQRSKTSSVLPVEKKEYFSLPPVLVKKQSFEDSLPQLVENFSAEDESVRRDRIEKYKKERRLALRQRFQVNDNLNDKKDEEMIRRFKQKILKSEKNDLSNRVSSDSSPNDEGVAISDHLSTKENSDKPPAAVTTISILYTSRKRRDSAEVVANENNSKPYESIQAKGNHIRKSSASRKDRVEPIMTKSLSSAVETSRELGSKCANCEARRPFTSSLERKVKSFVREESLVAKRVNQLAEASELSELASRRGGESESMRRRAHSTSGLAPPYCIRDIAAIFEHKDNNK